MTGIGGFPTDGPARGGSNYAGRRKEATSLVAQLSNDEKRILKMIVDGWSRTQMQIELVIDEGELGLLRDRLFAKISARSATDAVRVAIYAGLN